METETGLAQGVDEASLSVGARARPTAAAPGDGARATVAAVIHHFRRPRERPFTRAERERVTLLFGGLSRRHDRLLQAALQGLGYKAEPIATPGKADFQAGKEFGNNGQCNPTYFTVGALVSHLRHLRDRLGMATEDIISDYVFVTAGTCGPCRFGMYEAEYRLALRNAGFDGFRVIVFDQDGSLSQSGPEAGLRMNAAFFLTLLNATFMGDLLNAVAYHIRPYETVPGRTDAVLEQCLAVCGEALRTKDHAGVRIGALARLLARFAPVGEAQEAAAFLDQIRSTHYLDALRRCRALIDAGIEVDYTRAKPIAKITGEFWAQTTEGDGNFRMFSFLESEGAEVLVEPVATWIDYALNYWRQHAQDRRGLGAAAAPGRRAFRERLRGALAHGKKMLGFALARRVLAREHERMRRALGGSTHRLANQLELQRVGHPYYSSRLSGGEGHLEVAKNIYYINRDLAHLVLSLKPFGCMPSTQSDGAQAAVLAHYPDIIFLPVETSGEGDINAYSRVQMALGQAKARCRDEFQAALTRGGYTLAQIQAYIALHPALRRPLLDVPHTTGVVSRAANTVLHVARAMDRDPAWARRRARPGA